MIIVSEECCQRVVTRADAYTAVESVFSAMSSGAAYNFPVVREAIGHADALYGFKSGFDRDKLILGVKSGGYWPGNMKQSLSNHQSTVLLFNPDTGQLQAVVAGNHLTALRTAASSAVSINHLARKDATVLGMIGAGHQSTFQLRAALEQRTFKKVLAWNSNADRLQALAAVAEEHQIAFEAVSRELVARQSDVIITITSAHDPLLLSDWIRPGTHIACMGTDTKGKQELDPAIFKTASVFTDEVAQSVSIGEAQHAVGQQLIESDDITPIGDVIRGVQPGRRDDTEITVFDGTGVGLQDLAVAAAACTLAVQQGLATEIAQ